MKIVNIKAKSMLTLFTTPLKQLKIYNFFLLQIFFSSLLLWFCVFSNQIKSNTVKNKINSINQFPYTKAKNLSF